MPRSEVYQLRLTPDEKAALASLAKAEGMSIARMIRRRFGLSPDSTPAPNAAKLVADAKARNVSAAIQANKQEALASEPPPAEETPPEPDEPSREDIEALAQQIFYAEGKTMMVARREALERLSTR